jgi:hypothetical protein
MSPLLTFHAFFEGHAIWPVERSEVRASVTACVERKARSWGRPAHEGEQQHNVELHPGGLCLGEQMMLWQQPASEPNVWRSSQVATIFCP